MSLERVQKILAQAGIASRRKAEDLIRDGEVTINGKVAQLGDKADLRSDAIKVSGKLLRTLEPHIYLLLNKPKGVISMLADSEGRPTLSHLLTRVKARVFPIGRLDFNAEGALLLTNDGAFAEQVQKTSHITRVYHVKVRGRPDPGALARLKSGARVENRWVRPNRVRLAQELQQKSVIEVVFHGSGVTDVRGLFESKGVLVEKITRVAIGHLTLKGLQPGEYRMLKKSQVAALIEQPELGERLLDQEALRGPKPRDPEETEKQTAKRTLPAPLPRPKSRDVRIRRGAPSRTRSPKR